MFFDLPRELRDQIYDNVLNGIEVTFSDRQVRSGRGLPLSLFYGQSDNTATRPKLPPGLLASKQMLEESLEQLYRHASCSMTGKCDCVECEVVGSRCKYYPGNLLSISQVQNFDGPVQGYLADTESVFELCQNMWVQSKRIPETLIPNIGGEDTERNSAADSFFNYLLELPDHPAKQIKFSFVFPRLKGNESLVLGPVDCSQFWSLGPRFDRIVMRVVCPHIPNERAPWTKLRAHAIMFTRLQLELARTAVILVGGSDTSGYSVRDYMENGRDQDSLEWHVEARRLPLEQKIYIRYEGLHCFTKLIWTRAKSGFDYYKTVRVEKPNVDIAWQCKDTGEAFSLTLPLDNAEDRYMKEADNFKKVSKDLEAAFYVGA